MLRKGTYGDSEKAAIVLFNRAMTMVPCIVYFDEIDGLLHSAGSHPNQEFQRQMLRHFQSLLDNVVFQKTGLRERYSTSDHE